MGLGKLLLGLGLVLVFTGAVVILAERFGMPIGRLPGDLTFRGKHISVYLPLGTSLLLSLLLSIVFYLVARFHR